MYCWCSIATGLMKNILRKDSLFNQWICYTNNTFCITFHTAYQLLLKIKKENKNFLKKLFLLTMTLG